MAEFGENIQQEVAAVLARTQFTIHGPKRPVAVDSNDLPGPGTLPPPLVPGLGGGLPQPLVPLTSQPPLDPSQVDGGMNPPDGATNLKPPNYLNIVDTSAREDRSLLDDTPSKSDLPSPIMPQMESSLVLSSEYASPLSSLSPIPAAASSQPNSSLSSYIGFSAQSFSIPSISCNTAASDLLSPPSPLLQPSSDYSSSHPSPSSFASPLSFPSSQPSPSSFTPSTSPSSPMTGRDSPDSAARRNKNDIPAKILSGVFDVFDNLL